MYKNKKINAAIIFIGIIVLDSLNLLYILLEKPGILNHLTMALSTDPVNGSLWTDLSDLKEYR